MMTVYLWHLTALVILGAGSLELGGAGLQATPNTESWWLWRPAWLLLLAATTIVLVAVVGRFEDPPMTKATAARNPTVPLLELGVLIVLLGLLADGGLGHSARVAEPWLLVVAALAVLACLNPLVSRGAVAGRPVDTDPRSHILRPYASRRRPAGSRNWKYQRRQAVHNEGASR
jgi:hypothetical protein